MRLGGFLKRKPRADVVMELTAVEPVGDIGDRLFARRIRHQEYDDMVDRNAFVDEFVERYRRRRIRIRCVARNDAVDLEGFQVGLQICRKIDLDDTIDAIAIRDLHDPFGDVFFAIQGDRFDGSRFVRQAFVRGARAAVVAQDAVIEGLGPVQAIRRSVVLTRRRYAATGGVVIGTTFVIALIATLISGVPEVIGFIGGFGWAWVLLAIAAITSGLIQGPLTAHTATLMFMDSRARLEGHDLVQRARNRRVQP